MEWLGSNLYTFDCYGLGSFSNKLIFDGCLTYTSAGSAVSLYNDVSFLYYYENFDYYCIGNSWGLLNDQYCIGFLTLWSHCVGNKFVIYSHLSNFLNHLDFDISVADHIKFSVATNYWGDWFNSSNEGWLYVHDPEVWGRSYDVSAFKILMLIKLYIHMGWTGWGSIFTYLWITRILKLHILLNPCEWFNFNWWLWLFYKTNSYVNPIEWLEFIKSLVQSHYLSKMEFYISLINNWTLLNDSAMNLGWVDFSSNYHGRVRLLYLYQPNFSYISDNSNIYYPLMSYQNFRGSNLIFSNAYNSVPGYVNFKWYYRSMECNPSTEAEYDPYYFKWYKDKYPYMRNYLKFFNPNLVYGYGELNMGSQVAGNISEQKIKFFVRIDWWLRWSKGLLNNWILTFWYGSWWDNLLERLGVELWFEIVKNFLSNVGYRKAKHQMLDEFNFIRIPDFVQMYIFNPEIQCISYHNRIWTYSNNEFFINSSLTGYFNINIDMFASSGNLFVNVIVILSYLLIFLSLIHIMRRFSLFGFLFIRFSLTLFTKLVRSRKKTKFNTFTIILKGIFRIFKYSILWALYYSGWDFLLSNRFKKYVKNSAHGRRLRIHILGLIRGIKVDREANNFLIVSLYALRVLNRAFREQYITFTGSFFSQYAGIRKYAFLIRNRRFLYNHIHDYILACNPFNWAIKHVIRVNREGYYHWKIYQNNYTILYIIDILFRFVLRWIYLILYSIHLQLNIILNYFFYGIVGWTTEKILFLVVNSKNVVMTASAYRDIWHSTISILNLILSWLFLPAHFYQIRSGTFYRTRSWYYLRRYTYRVYPLPLSKSILRFFRKFNPIVEYIYVSYTFLLNNPIISLVKIFVILSIFWILLYFKYIYKNLCKNFIINFFINFFMRWLIFIHLILKIFLNELFFILSNCYYKFNYKFDLIIVYIRGVIYFILFLFNNFLRILLYMPIIIILRLKYILMFILIIFCCFDRDLIISGWEFFLHDLGFYWLCNLCEYIRLENDDLEFTLLAWQLIPVKFIELFKIRIEAFATYEQEYWFYIEQMFRFVIRNYRTHFFVPNYIADFLITNIDHKTLEYFGVMFPNKLHRFRHGDFTMLTIYWPAPRVTNIWGVLDWIQISLLVLKYWIQYLVTCFVYHDCRKYFRNFLEIDSMTSRFYYLFMFIFLAKFMALITCLMIYVETIWLFVVPSIWIYFDYSNIYYEFVDKICFGNNILYTPLRIILNGKIFLEKYFWKIYFYLFDNIILYEDWINWFNKYINELYIYALQWFNYIYSPTMETNYSYFDGINLNWYDPEDVSQYEEFLEWTFLYRSHQQVNRWSAQPNWALFWYSMHENNMFMFEPYGSDHLIWKMYMLEELLKGRWVNWFNTFNLTQENLLKNILNYENFYIVFQTFSFKFQDIILYHYKRLLNDISYVIIDSSSLKWDYGIDLTYGDAIEIDWDTPTISELPWFFKHNYPVISEALKALSLILPPLQYWYFNLVKLELCNSLYVTIETNLFFMDFIKRHYFNNYIKMNLLDAFILHKTYTWIVMWPDCSLVYIYLNFNFLLGKLWSTWNRDLVQNFQSIYLYGSLIRRLDHTCLINLITDYEWIKYSFKNINNFYEYLIYSQFIVRGEFFSDYVINYYNNLINPKYINYEKYLRHYYSKCFVTYCYYFDKLDIYKSYSLWWNLCDRYNISCKEVLWATRSFNTNYSFLDSPDFYAGYYKNPIICFIWRVLGSIDVYWLAYFINFFLSEPFEYTFDRDLSYDYIWCRILWVRTYVTMTRLYSYAKLYPELDITYSKLYYFNDFAKSSNIAYWWSSAKWETTGLYYNIFNFYGGYYNFYTLKLLSCFPESKIGYNIWLLCDLDNIIGSSHNPWFLSYRVLCYFQSKYNLSFILRGLNYNMDNVINYPFSDFLNSFFVGIELNDIDKIILSMRDNLNFFDSIYFLEENFYDHVSNFDLFYIFKLLYLDYYSLDVDNNRSLCILFPPIYFMLEWVFDIWRVIWVDSFADYTRWKFFVHWDIETPTLFDHNLWKSYLCGRYLFKWERFSRENWVQYWSSMWLNNDIYFMKYYINNIPFHVKINNSEQFFNDHMKMTASYNLRYVWPRQHLLKQDIVSFINKHNENEFYMFIDPDYIYMNPQYNLKRLKFHLIFIILPYPLIYGVFEKVLWPSHAYNNIYLWKNYKNDFLDVVNKNRVNYTLGLWLNHILTDSIFMQRSGRLRREENFRVSVKLGWRARMLQHLIFKFSNDNTLFLSYNYMKNNFYNVIKIVNYKNFLKSKRNQIYNNLFDYFSNWINMFYNIGDKKLFIDIWYKINFYDNIWKREKLIPIIYNFIELIEHFDFRLYYRELWIGNNDFVEKIAYITKFSKIKRWNVWLTAFDIYNVSYNVKEVIVARVKDIILDYSDKLMLAISSKENKIDIYNVLKDRNNDDYYDFFENNSVIYRYLYVNKDMGNLVQSAYDRNITRSDEESAIVEDEELEISVENIQDFLYYYNDVFDYIFDRNFWAYHKDSGCDIYHDKELVKLSGYDKIKYEKNLFDKLTNLCDENLIPMEILRVGDLAITNPDDTIDLYDYILHQNIKDFDYDLYKKILLKNFVSADLILNILNEENINLLSDDFNIKYNLDDYLGLYEDDVDVDLDFNQSIAMERGKGLGDENSYMNMEKLLDSRTLRLGDRELLYNLRIRKFNPDKGMFGLSLSDDLGLNKYKIRQEPYVSFHVYVFAIVWFFLVVNWPGVRSPQFSFGQSEVWLWVRFVLPLFESFYYILNGSFMWYTISHAEIHYELADGVTRLSTPLHHLNNFDYVLDTIDPLAEYHFIMSDFDGQEMSAKDIDVHFLWSLSENILYFDKNINFIEYFIHDICFFDRSTFLLQYLDLFRFITIKLFIVYVIIRISLTRNNNVIWFGNNELLKKIYIEFINNFYKLYFNKVSKYMGKTFEFLKQN